MKKIGIVGGIGPESTIDYYRSIIALCREKAGPDNYPSIIINSISATSLLGLMHSGQLVEVTNSLLSAVNDLAQAGAALGLLAANTPHVIFDDLAKQSPIPLISIVQATADAAKALGLTRLGLLGTRFTMQAGFYQKYFESRGMTIVVPREPDQIELHDRYMTELVHGSFREETRAALLAILERLITEQSPQGVILGGTELPLIFRAESHRGIPLLNTTRIHVERVVEQMLA